MLKIIWLVAFYAFVFQTAGQNLIPNPGFEQCDQCDNFGTKELYIGVGANDPIDWTAATAGTPDFRSVNPRTGKRHGGFYLGFPKFEYFSNHFTETLKAGAIYQFSFWIRPTTPNQNYIIDEIGVYIQKGPAIYQQAEPLRQLKPTFESADGDFINQSGYRQYSFEYKACGEEDHFIVGRFRSLGSGDTSFVGTKRPPNPANEIIYYFVDDFEMKEITPPIIVDLIPDLITLCPGDIKTLNIPSPYNQGTILWSTGETTETIIVPESNKVFVEVVLNDNCKTVLRDTTQIRIEPLDNIKILGTDSLCLGDTINLKSICNYCFDKKWSTGETTDNIDVFKLGIIKITARTNCKELKDSIEIFSLNRSIKSFIQFPNIVAPHGEDMNKSFSAVIDTAEESRVISSKMIIYNRWGKKVHETKGQFSTWTPEADLPMDTYLYICEIEYQDCDQIRVENFKGTITLVR